MTREKRERLAAIAGFFIGDGSLVVEDKPPNYPVYLAFYQNELETLDAVKECLGDCVHTKDFRNKIPNHCYRYNGRKIFKILRLLIPFMWECQKKRDAIYVLEHADLWRPLTGLNLNGRVKSILDARMKVANSVNHPLGQYRAKPDEHTSGTCDGHTPPP